jgi:hypothetical protein
MKSIKISVGIPPANNPKAGIEITVETSYIVNVIHTLEEVQQNWGDESHIWRFIKVPNEVGKLSKTVSG